MVQDFQSGGSKCPVYFFIFDFFGFVSLQPQRMIAEKAAVALGNINYIINGLKEHKFLIEKNRNEFMLINKKQLLEKWLAGYEERLKPTLHIGNFRCG